MTEQVGKTDKVSIKPGETVVVRARPGGEADMTQQALNQIDKWKQLKEEYAVMEKDDLEKEYRRIESDFDLHMRHEDRMQAILGVLVEKYHCTTEDLVKLRS